MYDKSIWDASDLDRRSRSICITQDAHGCLSGLAHEALVYLNPYLMAETLKHHVFRYQLGQLNTSPSHHVRQELWPGRSVLFCPGRKHQLLDTGDVQTLTTNFQHKRYPTLQARDRLWRAP